MEGLSQMEPLTIALIVLVVAGIWAVIELALFLRRTRKGVADITDSVSETISELRPTVAKLDGIVDELGPAAKQIEPILDKASTTVDLVNVNLVRTESVLSDVNTATNSAAQITTSVTGAAGSAAAAVAGAVNKVAGKVSGKASNKLEPASGEPARLVEGEAPVVEKVSGDAGYFTYPGAAQTTQSSVASEAASAPSPAANVDVYPGTENAGGLNEPTFSNNASVNNAHAEALVEEAISAVKAANADAE